jgi:hypothetical protein
VRRHRSTSSRHAESGSATGSRERSPTSKVPRSGSSAGEGSAGSDPASEEEPQASSLGEESSGDVSGEEQSPEAGSEEPTTSQPPATDQPQGRTDPLRLFSAQSFFNEPLAASVVQAPESARLVAAFVHQVEAYYGHAVINTTEWSAPVYTVPANAPTSVVAPQNVTCPRGEDVFGPFAQDVNAVPIPANAQAAQGTDEDMIIWQPSTGHEWELWRAQREGSQWTACWGGELQDARTSDGVFPAPLGVSASGLSILAGQIHLEELQQGEVRHALMVSLPETTSGFVWPANRTDGESHGAYAIQEGTRLRLRSSLNLGSLHLNPVALAVATAVQRYGMIVSDTAGAVALTAQDPSPAMREGRPNPYLALGSGSDFYDALDAIPWSELEVVSSGYRQ